MIKKVDTNSGIFFIYDFTYINGKKKRLYAKSENEIKEKIDKAKKEEQLYLSVYKPKITNLTVLTECIIDFIDNFSLSGIPKTRTEQLKILFSSLNHKCFQKNIYDIEVNEIQTVFDYLSMLYSDETISCAYNIMKNVFKVYDADFPEIQLMPYHSCDMDIIMLPTEYELMIDFCKRNLKFGKKRELILLSLFTGLPFSFLIDIKKKHINIFLERIEKDNKIYPLNFKAKEWLSETFLNYQEDDYLFLNEKNELINLSLICQTINKIVEILYLPCKITGKTIQKSFVIWCEHFNVADKSELKEKYGYSEKELHLIQNEYLKRKNLFSP